MISKQLMREILGKEVFNIRFASFGTYEDKNTIIADYMKDEDHFSDTINIHEVTHKCKVWAMGEGFRVIEYGYCVKVFKEDNIVFNQCRLELFDKELFFEACQWVIENR